MNQHELRDELECERQRAEELERRRRDVLAGNHEDERRREEEEVQACRAKAELDAELESWHDLRLTDRQAWEDAWEKKFGERYQLGEERQHP